MKIWFKQILKRLHNYICFAKIKNCCPRRDNKWWFYWSKFYFSKKENSNIYHFCKNQESLNNCCRRRLESGRTSCIQIKSTRNNSTFQNTTQIAAWGDHKAELGAFQIINIYIYIYIYIKNSTNWTNRCAAGGLNNAERVCHSKS